MVKLNALGRTLLCGTYLGGSANDNPFGGIAIDAQGNAYIAGETFSADFPVTHGTLQPQFGGIQDAFVVKLDPSATTLLYGAYLGGKGMDGVWSSIRLDASFNVYVAGGTESLEFPTTQGVVQAALGGGFDAFVTKLDLSPSTAVLRGVVKDSVSGLPLGCATVVANNPQSGEYIGVTDYDGRYTINSLPPGPYTVTAFSPGHTQRQSRVTVLPGAQIARYFALRPTAVAPEVAGIVTDFVTDARLAGIRVTAAINHTIVAATYTCASGRYEIRLPGSKVNQQTVTLEYSGLGYETLTQDIVVTLGQTTEADVELIPKVLFPGALMGAVRDSSSSAPIAGVQVKAGTLAVSPVTFTDASGAYTFSALEPGVYEVTASITGYESNTQTVVVNSGQPAAQQDFWLNSKETSGGCGSLAEPGMNLSFPDAMVHAAVLLTILVWACRRAKRAARAPAAPDVTINHGDM